MNENRLRNANKDLNNVKDPPTPNPRRKNSGNRDHNIPVINVNKATRRGKTYSSGTIEL